MPKPHAPGRSRRAKIARRPMLEGLETRTCLSLPAGWSLAPGGEADMRGGGLGFDGAEIAPREGQYMLWMSSAGSTRTSDYVNALGERGTTGTVVRGPEATLAAGDVVSLDYFFTSSDYSPYNDFGVGLVSGAQIFSLTQTGRQEFDGGWRTATFTAPADGTYQLALVASDQGDSAVSSDLYVDNVTGFTLPDEPGSVGPTRVAISALGPALGEGDGFGEALLVTRSGDLSAPLDVSYFVLGTAEAGADYEALPGVVTIPAGEESAVISVVPIQDGDAEPAETVRVFLDFGAGYEVDFPDNDQVAILDDDGGLPEVTIEATDPNASEAGGDSASFAITRDGDLSAPLTVSYSMLGPAKPGEDYVAPPGTAVIPAGESSVVVVVEAIDDALGEAGEEVALYLDPSDDFAYAVGYPGWASALIADDDGGPPTVAIEPGPAAIAEGGGQATVTFTRTGSLAAPLTITYGLYGPAEPGGDYADLDGAVTFAAGADTATVQVAALDDDLGEEDEEVIVLLEYPADGGYLVAYPGIRTIAIADDDGGLAEVTVEATTASVDESSGEPIVFTLTRSGGNTGAALTVSYFLYGGSFGDDYEDAEGEVTFAPGETTATVEFAPVDDELGEPDETVVIYLSYSEAGDYQVTWPDNSAEGTILDDDGGLATVTIAASTGSVPEGGPGSAALTVTRAGGNLAAPLTVVYTWYGEADDGSDYVSLPGEVTIPAGATTATILVAPLDDALGEEDEVVTVYLEFGDGYEIDYDAYQAEVAILDDDGGLAILSVLAGASTMPESGGSATFTITRAGGNLALPMDVNYYVLGLDGAEYPGDIETVSGLATIPAGQASTTVTFEAVDDDLGELDETVSLVLGQSDDGSYGIIYGENHDEVAILDDDGGLAIVSVAAAPAPVAEDGGPAAAFVVTRAGGNLALPMTIGYYTFGQAQEGADYEALPGAVTIPAGETSASIVVEPIDDEVGEPDEGIDLYLLPTGEGDYEISASSYSASTAIADDDGGVTVVAIAADAASLAEDGGSTSFTVTRTGGNPAVPLTVGYSVGGPALPGVDYEALAGEVTFAAGQTIATIAVSALDDSEGELDEDVLVQLYSGEGYELDYAASTHYAATSILDDDGGLPVVKIAASVESIEEGGPAVVAFTVTRSGGSAAAPITVGYGVFGGAASGVDFAELSGTVTIPAGELSATILVTPLDDELGETDETILVEMTSLSDPDFQFLYEFLSAEVAILDDDGGLAFVSFEVTDATVTEAGPTTGTIEFLRTGGNQALELTVAIEAFAYYLVATPGVDFAAVPSSITFAAGESSVTLTITALDDEEVEEDESIYVGIVENYSGEYAFDFYDATAVLTLVDDD